MFKCVIIASTYYCGWGSKKIEEFISNLFVFLDPILRSIKLREKIGLGEEFTGPKLFNPEAYSGFTFSKLCKSIHPFPALAEGLNTTHLSHANYFGMCSR